MGLTTEQRHKAEVDRKDRCLQLVVQLDETRKILAQPDDEYRAVYWTSDEQKGWALNLYLTDYPPISERMRFAIRNMLRFPPRRDRVLGFVNKGVLETYRDQKWHFHRKLGGLTFNLHILKNANSYGFSQVEIERADEQAGRERRLVSVSELLKCPRVLRKDSGGYEEQVLFKVA